MSRPHLRYKNQTGRERTWTIHFIALEKVVKGTLLLIVAFKLLTLFNRDVHGWAEDFITRHGIDIANRYVQSTLERLSGVGNKQLVEISIGATIYATLLFIEGIGLWLQKRWAEYLTTILTALFLPVELYEIFERFTWVRVGIFGLNIFVVWYLITRLKDEKVEGFMSHGTPYAGARIKICGITNIEDAQHAIDSGADELGLNFYEKSSRYISPKDARKIVEALPRGTRTIGVFVDKPINELLETYKLVGLDGIQLHGNEKEEYINELMRQTDRFIIKAFRVSSKYVLDDAVDSSATFVLLDGYSPNEMGGTGTKFDWNIASEVAFINPESVYLAGGLTPENVANAIRAVRPYAVDVASGVESSPGKKDPIKVAAFIKAAKESS